MGGSLTVSTQEVGVEGVPGLYGREDWVVVAEMIVGHQSVFRVPEDHQHLYNTAQYIKKNTLHIEFFKIIKEKRERKERSNIMNQK